MIRFHGELSLRVARNGGGVLPPAESLLPSLRRQAAPSAAVRPAPGDEDCRFLRASKTDESPINAAGSDGFGVFLRSLSFHDRVAEDEHVHARAEEAVHGFFGAADDGLIVIEGCVEDDGDAGELAEFVDQLPVARIRENSGIYRRR
jgi:hypothetical protein